MWLYILQRNGFYMGEVCANNDTEALRKAAQLIKEERMRSRHGSRVHMLGLDNTGFTLHQS